MNEFVPSRFVERVERLLLGIEPIDALRRGRVADRIDVALDGVPIPGESSWDSALGQADPVGLLRSIPRHDSCRHALVFSPDITVPITIQTRRPPRRFVLATPKLKSPLTLRLFDASRRFVPRRIQYPIPADIRSQGPPSRVRRPVLFPGAAYAGSTNVTGMRGRVTWKQATVGEIPARWVRVEATNSNGVVIGRAHGDDRGEFVLILQTEAGGPGDFQLPLTAQVKVFGPPAASAVSANDPLSDLPVEVLLADPDDVSPGEKLPAGYAATANSARAVTFQLGVMLTNQPKFFFTV